MKQLPPFSKMKIKFLLIQNLKIITEIKKHLLLTLSLYGRQLFRMQNWVSSIRIIKEQPNLLG